MKRITMAAAALVAFAGTAIAGTPVDLAVWTFETSAPITAGPHAAEGGLNAGAGSQALGLHASGATVYSNPVGNGSFESFSSNNWGVGDYYQFSTSTAGYESISIAWEQTRSSTGPGVFDLEWSVDGVNFNTIIDDYTIDVITWSSVSANAGSSFAGAGPASLDDQGLVYFRMINQVTPGGTAGSNRIDNVVISGVLIPTPGALALFGAAGLVGARRRRA